MQLNDMQNRKKRTKNLKRWYRTEHNIDLPLVLVAAKNTASSSVVSAQSAVHQNLPQSI